MLLRRKHGIGENRLTHFTIGENMGAYWQEVKTDVNEAAASDDPLKWAGLPLVLGMRTVFKVPTYALLGVFNKKVEPFNGFETGHAIQETTDELFQMPPHPIRAGIHLLNVPESLLHDIGRGIAGYTGQTRSHISRLVHAEPSKN